MKSRIALVSSIILVLCLSMISSANAPSTVFGKNKNYEDLSIVKSFYEDFERGIAKWQSGDEGKWRTIDFQTVSADPYVYEGKYSLEFSASAKKPRQSALCTYVYDFIGEEFVIPLEENTKFVFAWYIPSLRFSHIGTFLLFSDGRTGYYASHFYGFNVNKSYSYTYLFNEPRKTWAVHERNVFEDYEAVWSTTQDIKIIGLGIILADVYGVGSDQTAYYDSLYVGTELEMPGGLTLSVSPNFQAMYRGGTVTYDIMVSSIGSYDEEASLEVSGLPEGVDGIFEPAFSVPPFRSKLSITSSLETPADEYVITISATSEEGMKSVNAILKIYSSERRFTIAVYPNTQVIIPGDATEYNIDLNAFDLTNASIIFSIEGLPDDSTAEFSSNPVTISQEKEIKLSLIIKTEYSSPSGTYTLTIRGKSSADETQIYWTSATLVISGSSLKTRISTDKPSYMPGEDVNIDGKISNSLRIALFNISVSIQVTDQSGNDIHISLTYTDETGSFSDSFRLADDIESGTYIIFVTASKTGYRNAYSQYSFAVGESTSPSITITKVYSTDASDVSKMEFASGEAVKVILSITNGGAELGNGIIWVEVVDPNGVPLQVISIQMGIQNTVKGDGGPIDIAVNFILSNEASLGYYTMDGYVSDNVISEGGKFLAHLQGTFQVI